MVQLRDGLRSGITIINQFQFQYGTIKSIRRRKRNDVYDMFQFQYGTIKSL